MLSLIQAMYTPNTPEDKAKKVSDALVKVRGVKKVNPALKEVAQKMCK